MKKTTRTDTILTRLTQDILGKRLAPGTPLDETRLAEQFGASRTPIREALRQLAASGLVELRPHRAPLVAPTNDLRLAEMFDVMAELEALCASRATLAMNAAQRAELEMFHRSMAPIVRDSDVSAYRAANVVFHTMIYDGARNGYLKQIALSTRERLAPHRGVQLEAPARLAQSHLEHGEIVTAILRGDHEAAANAMRRHLTITRETLATLAPARASGDMPKK
ncbi:MAG: GntR family transcriptional regulator [Beijerinckiaceae bacterium]|nr:GntR family transcriptional regulator [Beijerinckiaceae bacterium]